MVTQENHYDPCGVAIEQEVVADKTKLPNFEVKDRFTYNGKELQGTLNYLDYGARMYDATIGRWGVVDPLAAEPQQIHLTPYNAFWDNPIKYTDPDGKCPDCPQKLISWLIGGYYKYVKGGMDYARNEAKHNTRSEYTERVPEQTRKIDHTVGKARAIQTSVEGASQIIESHTTMITALEGGAIAAAPTVAKTLLNVKHTGTNLVDAASKESTNALTKFYPDNNGFLGEAERSFLMPGDQISRYGSTSGKFFSPAETPLPMRALPPGANTNILNNYTVLKPFEVQAGKIVPAFGQPGLGTQYLSPVSAEVLLKRGIIGQ